MKFRWLVVALAALGLVAGLVAAADPALARSKRAKARCADRPVEFSWHKFIFGGPPQPNYCAPPVFFGDTYVGQDPDPNIRFQLRREPSTGFFPGQFTY